METEQRLEVKGSPSRCPYCHDSLQDLREVVACAACGARHHDACYRENGACAGCAATSVLVPESSSTQPLGSAPTRALHPPPEGSVFTLSRNPDGSAEIRWPVLPEGQLWPTLLLALLTIPLLGFGLVLLYWLVRHRDEEVELTLGEERLKLHRAGPPWGRQTDVERADLGPVELAGGVNLWVTTHGKRQLWLGSVGYGHVVPRDDLAWLHATLDAWQRGELDLRPEQPKKEDPKASSS